MISLFPEIYPCKSIRVFRAAPTDLVLDLRTPIVSTLLHLHALLLLPLFHNLWLSQGTGNANFFYASTLVFALANGFVLLDMLRGGLRLAVGEAEGEWDVVHI